MKLKITLIGLITFAGSLFADETLTYNNPDPFSKTPMYTPHVYAGIGYGHAEVEDDYLFDGVDEITSIDYDTLMLQIGYEAFPFLSFELRYWGSYKDGDYSLYTNIDDPEPGSYKKMSSLGVYFKPTLPVTSQFSLYTLLGMASTEVDGKSQWNEKLLDEWDFSWGLGASFEIVENLSVFMDWVSLYDDTYDSYYSYYPTYQPQLTSVDTLNFGLTYKF